MIAKSRIVDVMPPWFISFIAPHHTQLQARVERAVPLAWPIRCAVRDTFERIMYNDC